MSEQMVTSAEATRQVLDNFHAYRHTTSLTYSLWERLVFCVTGRFPRSVVEKRLDALDRDELELKTMRAIRDAEARRA